VLIIAAYDDTHRYLRQQVAEAIQNSDRADECIAIYHDPTSVAEGSRSPVQLLFICGQ